MKRRNKRSKRKEKDAALQRSLQNFKKSKRNAILSSAFYFLLGLMAVLGALYSELPLDAVKGGSKKFGPQTGWQALAVGTLLIGLGAYYAYSIKKLKKPNKALEPTTTVVTERAGARSAPPAVVAHL
jgi:hypothetical protein